MQKAKRKKCKVCGMEFTPYNSTQQTCAKMDCKVKLEREKREKKKARVQKANLNIVNNSKPAQKKEKTRKELVRELQRVTNTLVKLRDWGEPCISCGKPHQPDFEAGHFLGVGAHPQFRFELWNIHGQCRECNQSMTTELKKQYLRNLAERDKGACRVLCNADFWKNKKLSRVEIKELIKIRVERCDLLRQGVKLEFNVG